MAHGVSLSWVNRQVTQRYVRSRARDCSSGLQRSDPTRGKSDTAYLFGTGEAPVRLPNSKDGWFASAVRRAQKIDATFPRVTPHDLRHSAASLAVSAGANVKAVQRMLGHASAAMTLDVYSDLVDDDLDAVADRLDRARSDSNVGKMWAEGPSGE